MKNEEVREGEYANLMMFDPRGGNFGRRIVCMQEQLGLTVKDFEHTPDNDYEDFERTIGYTPSPLSTGKLPFQFNFDLLNAISFKKGCYLGQEIVSRSYFTGIVRRRVFPFIVNNEEALGPEQVKSITEGSVLKN
jgi:folate-binding protein YgfZ